MAWLDNKKTKIGGVGTILTGLGLIAAQIAADHVSFADIWQGVLVVAGGLTALGLGGKLQKLINAINDAKK